MGIFSRLADIINSNLNAILDRAEEPEKIIRLVIQEMEDTLVEVRSTAAKTIAEKKEISRRLARLSEAQQGWEQKAELALSKGRDDLAKGALLEKAKLAEAAQALQEEFGDLEELLQQGETDIVKLESKLREAKAKQQALAARHETAGSRLKVRRTLYDGRVEEAFSRFEQVEKKLDEAEGAVEAYDLGRDGRSLADEISDLAAESAIEEELAAMKARIGKDGAKKAGDGGKPESN
ncbi:phage shock protein PspA [Pelagibius litoralis]|uniref:Phage shock protein PspA n=1 Tax=Pelagibius litoralis TaxID=374515 RepID=A0A967C3V4_9PROT|nr:phage shock protein PspA [Pelagibius litoralis]NIA68019.1 phage shock protein PspA [Pelagibius litoralis]